MLIFLIKVIVLHNISLISKHVCSCIVLFCDACHPISWENVFSWDFISNLYSACQVILFKNPWDLNRFNVIPHFLGWYVRVPSVWLLLSKWYDSALVLCLWVRSCCLGIRYVTVVAVLLTHKKRKGKKKSLFFPNSKSWKADQPVFHYSQQN